MEGEAKDITTMCVGHGYRGYREGSCNMMYNPTTNQYNSHNHAQQKQQQSPRAAPYLNKIKMLAAMMLITMVEIASGSTEYCIKC